MKQDNPVVYLASQSPRRQELLTQLGWNFELLLPKDLSDLRGWEFPPKNLKGFLARAGVSLRPDLTASGPQTLTLSSALEDLEQVQAHEGALAYVRRVTQLKFELAKHLALQLGKRCRADSPICCADTTVVLDQKIFGKPQSLGEARAMLEALSGRTHRVYTCVVVGNGDHHAMKVSRSWVRFAPLSPDTLTHYLQTQEWVGKAGGYAVQGQAAAWIAEIRGSYSGIMGLPLFETSELLNSFVTENRVRKAKASHLD
jgi:septum formation protein